MQMGTNGQQQGTTQPPPTNGDGTTLHQAAKAAQKEAEAKLRDTWGTPQKLFDQLNAEVLQRKTAIAQARGLQPPTVGFTLDVCAEKWNAKCPTWFGPDSPVGIFDALTQGSIAGHDWFGNFPFSQLEKWLPWVTRWYGPEARAANCLPGIGVGIMPATRTEQAEWQQFIEPYRDKPYVWQQTGFALETRFITTQTEKSPFGRTKFVPPPGIKPSSPQFGTVVLFWSAL